jgi:hypothetical protein
MSWDQSTYSSMISSVGWDDTTEEMIVTFARNGRRAAYSGVTEEQANALANAPSVGQMFYSDFKDSYQFRYL